MLGNNHLQPVTSSKKRQGRQTVGCTRLIVRWCKRKEEQPHSFTYRTQIGLHTGNEPEPHANEVCEPEGTDTHFTKTMHKAQTADEHKQLSIALGKYTLIIN